MPTGYTASIYDGKDITFEDFALECSGAMGAMVMVRDEPNIELPKELKVSNYYYERVDSDRAKIEYWKNISDSDLESKAIEETKETLTSAYDSCVTKDKLRVRYEAMLEHVTAWTPPTEEHVNFKNFMIDQLESSINADCHQYYDLEDVKLQLENPIVIDDLEVLRAEKIAMAEKDLERSLEYLANEEKNIADKNQWIKDLRDSLI